MKAIGIDLGGSHVTAVVLDEHGNVLARNTLNLHERALPAVIAAIRLCAQDFLDENVDTIGIGVPGNVDPLAGSTRYLPSFNWVQPVLLADMLAKILGKKVAMRNDGRCAALAESRFGCGRKSEIFAMLTLGTGIGGALVQQGQLFDGCSFDAGDFGHHVICNGPAGWLCVCGKRGCFEMHASAQGLVRHYQQQAGAAADAKEVIDRVRLGDAQAKQALSCYKNDLAEGLANLITFYNPDTVAIGGGLSQAPELFEHLQLLVDGKTLPATRGKARILPAALGPDAGAIGAAILSRSAANR